MSHVENTRLLELASELLEDFVDDIVYVGGITTFLYVDVTVADDIRPTHDVDFIVPVKKRTDYDAFQERLRKKGFTHDQSAGAPICRFRYRDQLVVDAMPTDPSVLGFSNSWYEEGMAHRQKVQLGERTISVFPLEYFLASKFEAYRNRGRSDPRSSHDLEDIAIVLDGVAEFAPPVTTGRLKNFLTEMKVECLTEPLQEALSGFLRHNTTKLARLNARMSSL